MGQVQQCRRTDRKGTGWRRGRLRSGWPQGWEWSPPSSRRSAAHSPRRRQGNQGSGREGSSVQVIGKPTLREKRDVRASLASRPRRLGDLARARSTAGPGGQPPSTWSGERIALSATTLDQDEVQSEQRGRDGDCHVAGCYRLPARG